MVDWIMYGKIQEIKRAGLNRCQTSRYLGIDYKTVLKYWDMSPDEYSATRQENLLQELFLNDELVMPFLQHIHEEKPQYYRDNPEYFRD